MKKKATLDIISKSQKTTLYSISFEKDGTTEFEKLVSEFELNAKYNSDYQRIIAALQAILEKVREATKRIRNCTVMYWICNVSR